MSDKVTWLPGWYATRLHAISGAPPKGRSTVRAKCGAWVYGEAQTKWALRAIENGVPHCKHCTRRVELASGSEYTHEQREWIRMYRKHTGFEFIPDPEGRPATFVEAARWNIDWWESHASEVLLRIHNYLGQDDDL